MSYELIVRGISRKNAQKISGLIKTEAPTGELEGMDLKDKILIQKTD
jgi:hypothetical protein